MERSVMKNGSSACVPGVSTLNYIPGKKIKNSIGLVEYSVEDIRAGLPDCIEDIFTKLLQAAIDHGAEGVINVKITTGTYQRYLPTTANLTYVIAYGDAVIFE
ncbi:hypothetical protein AB6C54_22515 [Vibrio splendidus]